MNEDRSVLTDLPLFAGVPLEAIRDLVNASASSGWSAESVLFEEGDAGDAVHVITSGQVEISAARDDGSRERLAVVGVGEAVGELALLDGNPRSARATAKGTVTALTLRRVDFLSWLGRHPGAAAALLRTLATRLRAADSALTRRGE
jgi:CRP/FNR family transcriptional regulator, cyclic AMP receptor protein